ncbi:MAG: carboxylating nicotinate-nucleotide diphosphorylase [Thermotogae bacterium]|nr:carboxylating nicotinate-nucleotide diphosphorylase [Thermotogota bacterium]
MHLQEMLKLALLEDAPFGDITTESAVPDVPVVGVVLAKASGIMAAEPLFKALHDILPVRIRRKVADGERFGEGDVLAEVEGGAHDVLLLERTMLNLLGRMCGIASLTAEFVRRAGGVPIYDTRKTLPLWRYLDKYAVRMGGGYNHRMSLSEIVMVKDNHKRLAGSLRRAVLNVRERLGEHVPLIAEVESEEELRSLEGLKVDWVLLDNMSPETLRRLIPLARTYGFKVEVSGGITLDNVSEYAALRPDRISVGSLTKAASPVDISLEVGLKISA